MVDIELDARRGRGSDGRKFFRFTPRRAVIELASEEPSYSLSKPWAVFCLIFWAFLDGRPGKRTDDRKRRKIYTDDGRRAGNILLLFELHNALVEKSAKQDGLAEKWDNEAADIMRLFEDTEGFANAIAGNSAADLLDLCRESYTRVASVVEVVRYAECKQVPKDKRTIEDAKYFISHFPEFKFLFTGPSGESTFAGKRPGVKALEKTWAEYVVAAPVLFALHNDPKFSYRMFENIETAITWTKNFCADRERIALFLGTASAATNLLKKRGVRKTRRQYFKGIPPIDLKVTPLSSSEVAYIKQMDSKSHPDDGKLYRAPVKRSSVKKR